MAGELASLQMRNHGTLESMRKQIVSDPEILSGTPVFLGTRIPLEHVAGLIRKVASESELVEDFPSLNKEDFDYAREYARTHKVPGKPRKPLEVRRKPRAA